MSCGTRILEGYLESGVEWSGGAVAGRRSGVAGRWRGGGGAAEWSDWTVEWSGVEYLVNSRLPVYHVNI